MRQGTKDQVFALIGVALGGILGIVGVQWWLNSQEPEPLGQRPNELMFAMPPTTTTVPPTTTTEPPPTTTIYIEPEEFYDESYEETYVEPEPEVYEETAPGKYSSSTGIPDSYWDRMAYCETGGNWAHYPGARWSGGLGMYTPEWLAITGGAYGPSAGHASRETQIMVANLWVEKYGGTYGGGLSGWGCLPAVGYP